MAKTRKQLKHLALSEELIERVKRTSKVPASIEDFTARVILLLEMALVDDSVVAALDQINGRLAHLENQPQEKNTTGLDNWFKVASFRAGSCRARGL